LRSSFDVLSDKDLIFKRGNFCRVICGSAWPAQLRPYLGSGTFVDAQREFARNLP
jgi:hypothetical protein